MKKIIAMLLAALMIMGLCACGNSEQGSAESTHKNLSEEEMIELSEIAQTYYENAQFVEMMDAYQKLYDGGCQDASLFGFSNKSVEDALKTWEGKVARDKIVCEYVSYAIDSLREELKDPNSLVIYSIHLEEDKTATNKLSITFDYGAKNSFGGMARDSYSRTYPLSDNQLETIYNSLKEDMDACGATVSDSVAYLCGNYDLTRESMYQAMVDGTATW